MPPERILALIDAAVEAIAAHADELTALDQAIGDGDHGLNMARGFDAVAAAADGAGRAGAGGGAAEGGDGAGDEGRRRLGAALRLAADGHRQGGARRARRDAGRRRRRSSRGASPTWAPRPCSTCWGRWPMRSPPGRGLPSCAGSRRRSLEATQAPCAPPRGGPRFSASVRSDISIRARASAGALGIHDVCDVLEVPA